MSSQVYDIFDTFDDFFVAGKFEKVNELLSNIDVDNETSTTLIAYLTAGAWAKNKLNSYNSFYNRVKEKFEQHYGPDETKKMLVGF